MLYCYVLYCYTGLMRELDYLVKIQGIRLQDTIGYPWDWGFPLEKTHLVFQEIGVCFMAHLCTCLSSWLTQNNAKHCFFIRPWI